MFYTNANGLQNKIAELTCIGINKDCKILCVTESMFFKDILDCEINIPNYRVVRCDRNDSKGGGCCMYIHKSVKSNLIKSFDFPDCMAIEINAGLYPIVIILIYRSPSLTFDKSMELINYLSDFCDSLPNNNFIIMGDFNLPDISWDQAVVDAPPNSVDKNIILQKRFLDLFISRNLTCILPDDIKTRRRQVLDKLQESNLDQILFSDNTLLTRLLRHHL